MRILFIGDIFGEAGRDIIVDRLFRFRHDEKIDFVIANCENATHGRGLSEMHAKELLDSGVDFITMGNHTFNHPGFETFADRLPVVRPANAFDGMAGKGFGVKEVSGRKVAVLNLEGTVFIDVQGSNPFYAADELIKNVISETKIIIVDFHAESSGEKKALAFYLDGRVSAVLGTHTHVATADEQILPNGTAFMTDVGMTGVSKESVIGMASECVIRKMKDNERANFHPAKGTPEMNCVILQIDENTGKTLSIERKRVI